MKRYIYVFVACLFFAAVSTACSTESALESGDVETTDAAVAFRSTDKAINDCSAAQRDVIERDIRVARYALAALVRHGTDLNHPTWVSTRLVTPGLGSTTVASRVASKAEILSDWLGDPDLKITCERPRCDADTLAFVGDATVRKINFCDRYFTENSRVRAATLVHEASHGPLNTEDYYYECDLSLLVHDAHARESAGISAQQNVAHFYESACSSESRYTVRPGRSTVCETANRCVLPENNADYWASAAMLALGFDIGSAYLRTRGRETTAPELSAEMARIASGEHPRDILTCAAFRVETTWGAPPAGTEAFFRAVSELREFAIRAAEAAPCDALSDLFAAADEHGFMYTRRFDGEIPSEDGPLVFTRTGALEDFLAYARSHDDLDLAPEHFRACGAALAFSAIGL